MQESVKTYTQRAVDEELHFDTPLDWVYTVRNEFGHRALHPDAFGHIMVHVPFDAATEYFDPV
ncbi:MAG: hypothetical protein OEW14_20410 [Nitrospira sp.]|nr:hypothetical protein [Nitrospira sp.]MDH5320715.1 hypothetical protein [Nitrospira sp.]